jgi:hypothetical protein
MTIIITKEAAVADGVKRFLKSQIGMIQTYTLEDGFSFETIILPKGTLLFRGIQFSDLTPREHITEFINHGSCIPPTKNVYFYPVPYVAVAVNTFNVHILYTTNYDLELLLLVNPSKGIKPNASEEETDYRRILRICSKLSKTNACGHTMNEDDPCFTDMFLDTFPHIMGYIGLDAGDVDTFFGRYRAMLKNSMRNEIGHILPAIVENSRGVIGIPEIVLHPLHLRRNKVVRVKKDFNRSDEQIQTIINHRARWNYTPLLYVSSKDIFSLGDLLNKDAIDMLRSAPFINKMKGNPLFLKLDAILKSLSSKDGYRIHDTIFRIQIDMRTGFYRVVSRGEAKKEKEEFILHEFISNDNSYASTETKETSVEYKRNVLLPKGFIDEVKENYIMDMNEDYVNTFLHSFLAFSTMERGNFIKKYRLEEVFPRKDLQS